MKKFISLIIIVLILSGCVSSNPTSVYTALTNTIESEESKTYNIRTNNITNYVYYYVPSDLQEGEYDLTTFTFKYNESTIILNINIADIINTKYYSDQILKGNDFFNEDYLFLNHDGTLSTDSGDKQYILDVYNIEDTYLISFMDLDCAIYAYAYKGDVNEVLRNIYILAKKVDIDYDAIVADFSDKDVISSTKKTIDLFSYEYPTSGYLSDLITDENSTDEENSQN